MRCDFLIVGGGIGGAVLAERLARAGKKVMLLEKSTSPPRWVRPEILWPATAETLFSLAPRQTWEQEALLAVQGFHLHGGGRSAPLFASESLRETGVQPWSADPNRTRETLLRCGSCELFRGWEMTGVLREPGRITGVRARNLATGEEREFLAGWIIGDDGAGSLIREACGIRLRARPFPLEFLCFGCRWPRGLPEATVHVWLHVEQPRSGIVAALCAPLPGGTGACAVLVRSGLLGDREAATSAWEGFCARDAALREAVQGRRFPEEFARVRRVWGHAARYGAEGAILIGDAAHPASPAGAQGANMAVADARALAEILLEGGLPAVQAYERRRRPANARSLRFSRGAAVLWSLPDWCRPLGLFWRLLESVRRHRSLQHKVIRAASQAFQERGRRAPSR